MKTLAGHRPPDRWGNGLRLPVTLLGKVWSAAAARPDFCGRFGSVEA
jgi:hypothetical protein